MTDIIIDTLKDSIKLIPFLFLTFLLIEAIEHKFDNKKKIEKLKKVGPIFGSLLGAFPQCGFSVSATNLYVTRVIPLGALISVYLSTSDEMLPIMISKSVPVSTILKILALKIIIGFIWGFLIDLFLRKVKIKEKSNIKEFCNDEHCHCEDGNIFVSALKHTFSIIVFIMIISFVLNIGFEYLGIDKLSSLFMKNNIFSPFIISLFGLIPNCGASILITELYLNNVINFSSMIAGLLTGSGVALIVLFKTNKNIKENITILLLIYMIGSISGVIIEMIYKLL